MNHREIMQLRDEICDDLASAKAHLVHAQKRLREAIADFAITEACGWRTIIQMRTAQVTKLGSDLQRCNDHIEHFLSKEH